MKKSAGLLLMAMCLLFTTVKAQDKQEEKIEASTKV